jgi:hypothetical protein
MMAFLNVGKRKHPATNNKHMKKLISRTTITKIVFGTVSRLQSPFCTRQTVIVPIPGLAFDWPLQHNTR